MIRIGPAGWSYADWQGRVYPRKKPPGFHPLAFLCRYVDAVELNSSFYSLPRVEWAHRWVELIRAHPTFRFVAKLHRSFTHEELPSSDPELRRRADEFRATLSPLEAAGRLAALLVQFPHSFRAGPAAWRRLDRLRTALGPVPRVLEVRHRGWFGPAELERLTADGWSVAGLDLPAAADHPPEGFVANGPIGYLRLHGRNRQAWFDRDAGRDQRYDWLYAPAELDRIESRIRTLAGAVDETYVVTNNHFEGKAVANALELRARLAGDRVDVPGPLLASYPRLAAIARPAGQGELFSAD